MAKTHDSGLAKRDDRLLEQWAGTFRPALLSYVRRRAPAHIEPEDVVQNVFVRLAKRADLESVERPERYLFSVAASALADAIRKGQVRHEGHHLSFDETILIDTDFSAEHVVISKQGVSRLIDALHELPKRTRTVFFLYHFENELQADIARMLGVSVSTVENDMRKATAFLLQRVENIL